MELKATDAKPASTAHTTRNPFNGIERSGFGVGWEDLKTAGIHSMELKGGVWAKPSQGELPL